MERLNLQEKRNTYASVSAGILVSINIDYQFNLIETIFDFNYFYSLHQAGG